MPLDLNSSPSVQTAFNASVSVDKMTWGFWIKAGIGLAVGWGVGMACWGLIILTVIFGLGLGSAIIGGALAATQPRSTLHR